jgi:hypothetical protein
MTFYTRKVLVFETITNDENLSGKEITSIMEELRDNNYAPSHPFGNHCIYYQRYTTRL